MTRNLQIHPCPRNAVQIERLMVHENDRPVAPDPFKQNIQGLPLRAPELPAAPVLAPDERDAVLQNDNGIAQHRDTVRLEIRHRLRCTADVFVIAGDPVHAHGRRDGPERFTDILLDHRPEVLVHDVAGKEDEVGIERMEGRQYGFKTFAPDDGPEMDVGD